MRHTYKPNNLLCHACMHAMRNFTTLMQGLKAVAAVTRNRCIEGCTLHLIDFRENHQFYKGQNGMTADCIDQLRKNKYTHRKTTHSIDGANRYFFSRLRSRRNNWWQLGKTPNKKEGTG
ncbi:unnamed protein product, partial [Ectocarpus sp. 4 AP-2014]